MELSQSRATVGDLLRASSGIWTTPEFETAFPDGIKQVVAAVAWTVDPGAIRWVESTFDPESPKAQAAIYTDELFILAVLTAHGFGLHTRPLVVNSVRVTSTPFDDQDEHRPFRFSVELDAFSSEFPWDPENTAQDGRLHEQYQRLLAKMVAD